MQTARAMSYPPVGPAVWRSGCPPRWQGFAPLSPLGAPDEESSPVVWSADFAAGSYMRFGEASALSGMLEAIRSSSAYMPASDGTHLRFAENEIASVPGAGASFFGQFTNLLSTSNTAGWTAIQSGASATVTEVASCVEGQTGRKYRNNGASYNRIEQARTIALGPYVCSVILENIDAAVSQWGLAVGANWISALCYTWATGIIDATAGSHAGAMVSPLGTGPNGGEMVRLDATVTNVLGTGGIFRIYPAGPSSGVGSANALTAIVHHAQLTAGSVAPPLVVSGTSPGTRLADDVSILSFADMAASCNFEEGFLFRSVVSLSRLGAGASRTLFAAGLDADNCVRCSIGADDKVRLVLRKDGIDALEIATGTAFTAPGDVEIAARVVPGSYSISASGLAEGVSAAADALPALVHARLGSDFALAAPLDGVMKLAVLSEV